ncbi:MAG: hypothetical protein Q9207_001324 [Kuettlingeria erythrocarpa]
MAPPPAKRRRRIVASTSEDEQGHPSFLAGRNPQSGSPSPRNAPNAGVNHHADARSLPAPLRSRQKSSTTTARASTAKGSPPTSLERRSNPKSTVNRENANPTALDTYFSAKRVTHTKHRTGKAGISIDEEDFIEDDSFDDELRRLYEPRKGNSGARGDIPAPTRTFVERGGGSKLLTGGLVFRKAANNLRDVAAEDDALGSLKHDTRPWADHYGPASAEELAVHRRKVADVRSWLDAVYSGRSKKRLLVLKGAPGVGKTATISTLARAMDLDVLEWKNPALSGFSSGSYISASTQFEDFLGRGGKFASLDVAGDGNINTVVGLDSPENAATKPRRKIILIEEFPNISISSSASAQLFRTSILRYLATSPVHANHAIPQIDVPEVSTTPLVMIVTESQVNSATSVSDSFTAHRLLGVDLLSHPGTDTIEFNPIAPTYIIRALNLVIQKEARDSGRRRVPGPAVLRRLGEVGDVRSAIGSLEFLCLQGHDSEDWGARIPTKGKKGAKNAAALTKVEKEVLELVTQREASLGLFHAVGKVVYNKREGLGDGKPPSDPPPQPPHYLPQHVRLKPSDISVDGLANETATDTQTFIAALHENYVLSCDGNAFTDTQDACIECLSDTDVLLSERGGGRFKSSAMFQGAGTDSVRQDEIAFQVAVRGLLFGLPSPVKRGPLPPGMSGRNDKGDAYKMFYPMSMRLGKQMTEVGEMIDRWTTRWRGSAASAAAFGGGTADAHPTDGVASWAQRTSVLPAIEDGAEAQGTTMTPLKDAMVLEILPYTAMIGGHRPDSPLVEELNRITNVRRAPLPATEESLDGIGTKPPPSKRAPAKTAAHQKQVTSKAITAPSSQATAVEQAVGHLYLSDDDIED